MSPKIDLSTWLNIDEVVAMLGCSRRTLEREVSDEKWQTRQRARPGKRPETVFNPEEVAARMPAPISSVVKGDPAIPASDNDNPATMAELAESDDMAVTAILHGVGMMFESTLARILPPPAPPQPQTTFVGLEEASAFTGLSVGCLTKLVKDGKIGCVMERPNKKGANYTQIMLRWKDLETFAIGGS